MINKFKQYLYRRECDKKKQEIIKFLENVKESKRGIFNYKVTDTYFHFYIKNRTYSLNHILYYDIDMIIDIVCYQLFNNRIGIKKSFFINLKN